jgi:uncharacterized protein
MYAQGVGVAKDRRQAAAWWLKAAEKGDSESQYLVAHLYEQSGEAMREQAEFWYRAAAENGYVAAMEALGKLSLNRDFHRAEHWLRRAIEGGATHLFAVLGDLLMTKGKLGRAEAFDCYLQAAQKRDPLGCHRLGELVIEDPKHVSSLLHEIFPHGSCSQRGSAQGLIWSPAVRMPSNSEDSALGEDPAFCWQKGRSYRYGTSELQRDSVAAQAWLTKAAYQGHVGAQAALAVMYYQGEGIPKNDHKAVQWWTLAAEQGDAESQYNLALMYEKACGVPQDCSIAIYWYKKAAEQGIAPAQNRLGMAYASGMSGRIDLIKAYAWFSVAECRGDEPAALNRQHAESLMAPDAIVQGQEIARRLTRSLENYVHSSRKRKSSRDCHS